MSVQARASILVLPGLVLAQAMVGSPRMAASLAVALLACSMVTGIARLGMAALLGLRHRRTVLHGLGASHDWGRLKVREALLVHLAGILAVGAMTLACRQNPSYLAQSVAGVGIFWTAIQAAPVLPTCGGEAAWSLLQYALGPVRGATWSARITILGGIACCWIGLQLGTVFVIPLCGVAIHNGWRSYRTRTTEPVELFALPGAPA